MMPCLQDAAAIGAAAVLVHFSAAFVASTSRKAWPGERWRWWVFSVAIPCVASGAFGVVAGVTWAPAVAIVGSALFLVANRRKCLPMQKPDKGASQ